MKKHLIWSVWMALGMFMLWSSEQRGWSPLGLAAFVSAIVCFASAYQTRRGPEDKR